MWLSALVNLAGLIIFLFFLWRRLKEDYSSEVIFSLAFFIIAGIILGYLLSLKFFPSWWFWFEGFGAFLGFSLGIVRYNLRFFETFEAGFVGILPWLALYFLQGLVRRPDFVRAFLFISNLALLFIFDYLDKRYKSFTWYKSGRIGFAGLSVAAVFFLIRAAIATFFSSVLSFPGRGEAILAGVCAFSLFLLIYNLCQEEK